MDREDVNIRADADIQEPIKIETKATEAVTSQESKAPQESQDSIHDYPYHGIRNEHCS